MLALVFVFTLWLGCYLLSRHWHEPRSRYTAFGLLAIATISLIHDLAPHMPLSSGIAFLPALYWLPAALLLLPESSALRSLFTPYLDRGLIVATLILLVINQFVSINSGIARWILVTCDAVLLLGIAGLIAYQQRQSIQRERAWRFTLTAALFFAISTGIHIFGAWGEVGVLLVALDLLLLGVCIGYFDALEAGETFWPDVRRSFLACLTLTLLFGGQVILGGGSRALLYGILTAIILTQVYASVFNGWIDRLTHTHPVSQSRAELISMAENLASIAPVAELAQMDEEMFARHVRRALSRLDDLNHLARNPLINFTAHPNANTLQRAHALKQALNEAIATLKPTDAGDFGTSDEWRYFNVLYYPYVLSLKPSTRFYADEQPSPEIATMRTWLQSIPERTLHNWQTTASRLVAQHLRESGSLWQ